MVGQLMYNLYKKNGKRNSVCEMCKERNEIRKEWYNKKEGNK
jgi:hypothetical protein